MKAVSKMDAEELKKARAICEAATAGPWAIVNYAGFAIYKNPKINIGLSADEQICTFSEDDYYEEMEQPNNTIDNAEFIIFARTALPAALDEIERLQKANNTSFEEACLYKKQCDKLVQLKEKLYAENEKLKKGLRIIADKTADIVIIYENDIQLFAGPLNDILLVLIPWYLDQESEAK